MKDMNLWVARSSHISVAKMLYKVTAWFFVPQSDGSPML